MTHDRIDSRTAAALAITLLLWGSAFPCIREASHVYSAQHLTLLRMLFAAVALAAVAPFARPRMPERRDWPLIAACAFVGVPLYHTALNIGLRTVRAGAGSLIVNTAPVVAWVLAAVFLKERVRPVGWVGLAICVAGAAVIALGEGKGLSFPPGAWLMVACAILWGGSTVLNKVPLRKYGALELSCYMVWLGTTMLSVYFPGLLAELRSAPLATTLVVGYLGVFPIAIAYITWSYALKHLTATRTAGFTYVIPAIAILVAWAWTRELPGHLTVAGGLIALVGVYFVQTQGRPRVDGPALS